MAKQEFDNTNRASVWVNEGFLENDSQPALRIKMNVDGEDKELSLFINDRHDDAGDLQEILAELIEIIVEGESKSPVFTGKVQEPFAKRKAAGGGESGGRRGGRKSRGGRKPAAEQTDSGDTW